VHRAARIAAAAHGGQVIMSEATSQLVSGRLPGVNLADLGWHRLKDIVEPERLHQLVAPGLQSVFPPLMSLGNRSSLPAPATPFIARARELDEVIELMSGDQPAGLVTMTGPGGVGKSRLALAVADSLASGFRDGVYFVPLAPVSEAAVMWTTIAELLGITGDGRSPPTFFDHIADRQALLVLDNVEQLACAGDVVAQLMAAAPRMKLVVTSRRPLHVPGEHIFEVPPLRVARELEAGDELGGAVELFVLYARMVRPTFMLTAENTDDVVAICDRLDGLPLAIELAAARANLLSPRALLSRLDRSLEFAARDAARPGRQRTIRDTVAWSYDLLDPRGQSFFRRMAVFAGGCDLEAVAAVAARDTDALDSVTELVDASLLAVREDRNGEPRIGMLQTVRSFALERLAEAGELDDVSGAHASHYAAMAGRLTPELRGPRPLAARDRLETELANMRAALTWCLDPPAPPGKRPPPERVALGLRMCQGLHWLWYACGYTAEGQRWQRRAVELASEEQGTDLAGALHGLAVLLLQQGEVTEAKEALTTCLAIWRQVGDRRQVAKELNSLGIAYWTLGDIAKGKALLEESIGLAREIGDEERQGTALANLGLVEISAGHPKRAIGLLEQAQAIDEKHGNTWGCAVNQTNIAAAMLRNGQTEDADALLRRNAAGIVALGDIELTIDVIELFACIAVMKAEPKRTARLAGAAEALREQAGMPRSGPGGELVESYLDKARSAVSPRVWDKHCHAGHTWSPEQALVEAGVRRP
jgi:predicted ATPase